MDKGFGIALLAVLIFPIVKGVVDSNETNVPQDIDTPIFIGTKTFGSCEDCIVATTGTMFLIKCHARGTESPNNMKMYFGSEEVQPWSSHKYGLQVLYDVKVDDHNKTVVCKSYYDSQREPMVASTRMFVKVLPSEIDPILTLTREGNFQPSASCSTSSGFRPAANMTVTIINQQSETIKIWQNSSSDESLRNTEIHIETIRRKWFGDTIKCCLQHFLPTTSNDTETICVEKMLNFTIRDKEPTENVTAVLDVDKDVVEESSVNVLAIVLSMLVIIVAVSVLITIVIVKKRKKKPNLLESQVSHDIRISAEINRESAVYNSAQSIGSFRASSIYNPAAGNYGESHLYNSAYSTGKTSDNDSVRYEQMQANGQGRTSYMNIKDAQPDRNTVAVPSYEALDKMRRTDNNYAKLQGDSRHSYIYMIGANGGRQTYEALDKSRMNVNNTYTHLYSQTDRQSYTDMSGRKEDTRKTSASAHEPCDRSNRSVPNTSAYEPFDRSNRSVPGTSASDPLDRSNRSIPNSSTYEPLDISNRGVLNTSTYDSLDNSTEINDTYDIIPTPGGRFSYIPAPLNNRPARGAVSAYEALERPNRVDNHTYEPLEPNTNDYENLKSGEEQ